MKETSHLQYENTRYKNHRQRLPIMYTRFTGLGLRCGHYKQINHVLRAFIRRVKQKQTKSRFLADTKFLGNFQLTRAAKAKHIYILHNPHTPCYTITTYEYINKIYISYIIFKKNAAFSKLQKSLPELHSIFNFTLKYSLFL